MKKESVLLDAYFKIDVEMDKFKFSIPARGYNLKSWLDFQKSLGHHVTKVSYKETSEKVYTKMMWGI
jgi:hypothetical protein